MPEASSVDIDRLVADTAILIPAYGGAARLRVCLASLALHVPSYCNIFVLDDGTPDESIADCCAEQFLPNLTYVRSERNRGFVETCNWGCFEVADVHCDKLLLNSDTEVTSGFLEEMVSVLYSHDRHAVVTPRSNNATIYSTPFPPEDLSPEESYRIWLEIKTDLPRFRVMPTAVGFCMLVRGIAIQRFGLFDPVYSPGYNEENDFICRINRCGFSAVAANHAFVYHFESSTFGPRRKALENEHRVTLLSRYPEYQRKVSEYIDVGIDPVEKFSILRRKHRQSILFDLFHLPPKHSGTSEFALNLLREAYLLLQDEYDVFVGLSEEGRFFSNDLNGYQLFEDRRSSNRMFDLAFKPCQIFTWNEFRRMNRLSPRVSFVLQDIIAVRCDYLSSVDRKTLFQKTLELSDQVYTISQFTRSDFQAFFNIDTSAHVIHHGSNYGKGYAQSTKSEYVLLIGNGFAHKGVDEALKHLTEAGPVKVLGGDSPRDKLPPNMTWFTSGGLSQTQIFDLLARASLLVYPSHYEGFGLPIIDALSLGKRVIALDNQINREIAGSLKSSNLVLIQKFSDLGRTVRDSLSKAAGDPLEEGHSWKDVAVNYVESFRTLLAKSPDAKKMRERHELFQVLDSARHP